MESKIKWIISKHKETNHYYDQYLPYEFHLRMVVQVANDFIHIVKQSATGDIDSAVDDIILACWGHDLIEDTRTSFNDVKGLLGSSPAEIIFACTNEKGKTRKDRANENYYRGIRNTEGAVFVKLCDRIANVQYSKMTKSRMFEMYKRENENFEKMMGRNTDYKFLEEMFNYLENLFVEA